MRCPRRGGTSGGGFLADVSRRNLYLEMKVSLGDAGAIIVGDSLATIGLKAGSYCMHVECNP
jgi:hypothetical protein